MENNEVQNKVYHTHITAKHKWFDLKLKEVWRYRDLIWLFTKRTFVLSYKQTVLGPAWIFITPLLTSLIYAFVFGNVAGMSPDGVNPLLFYLSSNAIWTYFASCLTQNANAFRANAAVFGKVYFPRLTVPISNVLSTIIKFFVQMLLAVILLAYFVFKNQISPEWAMLPMILLVLLQLGMLGLGFGIIISSFTTKYRDLSILVGFGVQLWMYATPVIYTMDKLGTGKIQLILMSNPVTPSIEVFRHAFLGMPLPDHLWTFWGISWIVTVVVTVIGMIIFNKVEKTFMDTV